LVQQRDGRRRETLSPAQREQQLLAVARDLLLSDDQGELTVEKVTTAAKVAKGTFYLYFDSKDHLLAVGRLPRRLLGHRAKRNHCHHTLGTGLARSDRHADLADSPLRRGQRCFPCACS
jgi:hypothetical protein